MSEHDIYSKIEQLVATEHKLREQNAAGEIDPTDEMAQLASIEHALDQCWDLLRQRRARHDAGQNPEDATANSVEQVEHYLQ
jgi:prephenate dehydratase